MLDPDDTLQERELAAEWAAKFFQERDEEESRIQETSIEAAIRIKPVLPKIRIRILEYFLSQGKTGATDQEVQFALEMPGSTERPARLGLVKEERIFKTPERRLTIAGRNAIVWSCVRPNDPE